MLNYSSPAFRIIRNLLVPFPDKFALSVMYQLVFGRPLDWENPSTLNEWINIQKLKDIAFLGPYADKLAAKKIIGDIVGEKYVTPVIWQGTDPADIPFDSLPYPVIVKANHGSKGSIVLRSRDDVAKKAVVRNIRRTLGRKYWRILRENHYKQITPSVFVEPLLIDSAGRLVNEFNFYVLDGKIEIIKVIHNEQAVDIDRDYTRSFLGSDWTELETVMNDKPHKGAYSAPDNHEELSGLACALASSFAFARIDFFSCDEFTRVGELTFTPSAGFMQMFPPEMQRMLYERLGAYGKKGYLRQQETEPAQ